MNRNQKIIISIVGIFIVMIALIGLTYGYYLNRINGNTNSSSIKVSTVNLKLVYDDMSDGVIGGNNIYPSDQVYEKSFSVKNEGGVELDYAVYLVDVINTFTRKDDIKYTVSCSSNQGTCPQVINETTFPNGVHSMVETTIQPGEIHTFKFAFTYKDSGTDQSVDMGKKLSAKIQIFAKNDQGVIVPYDSETLAFNVINNSLTSANGTTFVSDVSFSSIATSKLMSTTKDNYGTSYYYRGNVVDNYLNFAGMCWRVVRIQGDGSTKLILEDQDEVCSEDMDGNWSLGTSNFGYNLTSVVNSNGSTSSSRYLFNFTNISETQSMGYLLKEFETNKLSSYIDYLKGGDWCLNEKPYSRTETDTANKYLYTEITEQERRDMQYNKFELFYDSYVRLKGDSINNNIEPSLECDSTQLNYWSEDQQSPIYVGAITADEVVLAGGKDGTNNYNYYLVNDFLTSNSTSFWTLSPKGYNNIHEYVYYVNDKGRMLSTYISNTAGIRPSIVVNNKTKFLSGEGTIDNPYIIG